MAFNYHQSLRETTEKEFPLKLTARWLSFLSLSSKYWNPELINELYLSILTILWLTAKEAEEVFAKTKGFESLMECRNEKEDDWLEFVGVVENI